VASFDFVDRATHRRGGVVRVQDRHAVQVMRGAADGLDQRAFLTQQAFLVGVQDRDQRHLRQVQALAQQVNADQDAIFA